MISFGASHFVLYNVDGRMSPPYKWLLISTTLFQQSVSAYRQGVLPLKTLKDGFECSLAVP